MSDNCTLLVAWLSSGEMHSHSVWFLPLDRFDSAQTWLQNQYIPRRGQEERNKYPAGCVMRGARRRLQNANSICTCKVIGLEILRWPYCTEKSPCTTLAYKVTLTSCEIPGSSIAGLHNTIFMCHQLFPNISTRIYGISRLGMHGHCINMRLPVPEYTIPNAVRNIAGIDTMDCHISILFSPDFTLDKLNGWEIKSAIANAVILQKQSCRTLEILRLNPYKKLLTIVPAASDLKSLIFTGGWNLTH